MIQKIGQSSAGHKRLQLGACRGTAFGGKGVDCDLILQDFALPVGNLCVALRLSPAFRDRHSRYMVEARQENADEVGNITLDATGFDVNCKRIRIGAVISHYSVLSENALCSLANEGSLLSGKFTRHL
ncbi:hypothetical protein ACFSHP_11645 [Novosphingobium panipatense]